MLRWHVEHRIVAIPKSTNAERIAENAAIFHFALTESEVEELDEALSRLDLTAARQLRAGCGRPETRSITRDSSLTIVTSALSQIGQRSTTPAPRKTWVAPTGSVAPLARDVPIAVVMSKKKTSIAALGPLNLMRFVPELDEGLCDRLDEPGVGPQT